MKTPNRGNNIEEKKSVTMDVIIDDEVVRCHCPTTGRIGNIDLAGIP